MLLRDSLEYEVEMIKGIKDVCVVSVRKKVPKISLIFRVALLSVLMPMLLSGILMPLVLSLPKHITR